MTCDGCKQILADFVCCILAQLLFPRCIWPSLYHWPLMHYSNTLSFAPLQHIEIVEPGNFWKWIGQTDSRDRFSVSLANVQMLKALI